MLVFGVEGERQDKRKKESPPLGLNPLTVTCKENGTGTAKFLRKKKETGKKYDHDDVTPDYSPP